MKFIALLILTLYVILKRIDCTKESQVFLSNKEIREILKCFGDLNLEEGCVVCRYVTQKIYKVLDISSMCPDIVETKLKLERERKWNPDPQMINKWTVLFNLQKDYLNRIKPAMDGMKNYNEVFNEKIKKQKLEKQNLENLIQFQNKINADLASRDLIKNTKFDVDNKACDDEELKYKSNKIVAPVMPNIRNKNKMLSNWENNNSNNMPRIKDLNKKLLGGLKAKSSSFIESLESVYTQVASGNSDSVEQELSSFDSFEENKIKASNNQTAINALHVRDNKHNYSVGVDKISESENQKLIESEFKKKIGIKKLNGLKPKSLYNSVLSAQKNLKKDNPNLLKTSPVFYSSFLETKDNTHFDRTLFDTLIKKSENYNLETQRRGRRRSRFPDPQWDCAETQIAKLVRYLCEEEVSSSYQKYCKPIFEQINTMIESYLYHDNNIEICQNLHMCPVSVDI